MEEHLHVRRAGETIPRTHQLLSRAGRAAGRDQPVSSLHRHSAGQRDGSAGAVGDPAVERQHSHVSWKLPDNTEEKPKSLLTATLLDLDFFDSYFNRSETQKAQGSLDQGLGAEHMALLPSPLPWLPRDRLVAREGTGALLQHSHHRHSAHRNCPPTTTHNEGTRGFPATCSDRAARTLQSTPDMAGEGSEGLLWVLLGSARDAAEGWAGGGEQECRESPAVQAAQTTSPQCFGINSDPSGQGNASSSSRNF